MTVRSRDHAWLAGTGIWLCPPDSVGGDGPLARANAAAAAAEQAGAGAVWVSEPVTAGPGGVPYEVYSLLGALAVGTDRVHLGAIERDVDRRAPSVLAKIVTGLDVISHGRGLFSLGSDSAGSGTGNVAERLTEALAVGRAVLEDERPTVAGEFYEISDAVNRPSPVQVGGIPLVVVVCGGGPDRQARIESAVAGGADAVVVDGGPDGVRDAARIVADRGAVVRRVPAVIGMVDPDQHAGQAATARDAGASTCLVGVAFPWEPQDVAARCSGV